MDEPALGVVVLAPGVALEPEPGVVFGTVPGAVLGMVPRLVLPGGVEP